MNPWPWLFFIVGWPTGLIGLYKIGVLPARYGTPLNLLGWLIAWVFFWQW